MNHFLGILIVILILFSLYAHEKGKVSWATGALYPCSFSAGCAVLKNYDFEIINYFITILLVTYILFFLYITRTRAKNRNTDC